MNPEQARQLQELIDWKRQRETQQLAIPLDVSSRNLIIKDLPVFKRLVAGDKSPLALTQKTTVGGSATETFTIAGIETGDFAFVQIVNPGTNNVTILKSHVSAANTLSVTFSNDPLNNTVIAIAIFRSTALVANSIGQFEINGREYNLLISKAS